MKNTKIKNKRDKTVFNTGDVVLFNNTKKTWYPSLNWFSMLQHFFTRMPYSHVGVGIGTIKGIPSQLEADHSVEITPIYLSIKDLKTEFEIWRCKADSKLLEKIITKIYEQYATQSYGYLQTVWFAAYRWLFETSNKLLKTKFDVRKHKNWFPGGVICSEIAWKYYDLLGDHYPKLKEFVNQWSINSFHAGDAAIVVRVFPELFELVDERKLKNQSFNILETPYAQYIN